MEKVVKDNQYKIVTILITILLFVLFKDVPYIGILLNYQFLTIFLSILIAILFKLKAETVLKIALVLYLISMFVALLGVGDVANLGIAAFGVFIFGWFQAAFSSFFNKKNKI